ncbi:hypothetical protein PENDEC_c004G05073 [Penicillium decumbens]|uniref:Uncharacterized protein n=1 Tax=Penicillium decumbens TaxID=69771 RepID=A0A1V6PIE4_PENDC|nr:hypothetical protein PENDEC_c004G05073 [Penicillium decumbens]
MSFLASIRAGSRRAMQSSYITPSATSGFQTSAARRTLKESDKNRDELPDVYEAEKERQLKESKEGKGHWNDELASNSEASVKADRDETGAEDVNVESMQERTKNLPNEKK